MFKNVQAKTQVISKNGSKILYLQNQIKTLRVFQVILWQTLLLKTLTSTSPTEKPVDSPERKLDFKSMANKKIEIDNDRPYMRDKEVRKGDRLYPVVFEPIKNIRLSRSTYKVTSFIEFRPYIDSMDRFDRVLRDLKIDIGNPNHFMEQEQIYTLSQGQNIDVTNPDIIKLLCDREDMGRYCDKEPQIDTVCMLQRELLCRTARHIYSIVQNINYIEKSFHQIRNEFLSAIDYNRVTPIEEPRIRQSRSKRPHRPQKNRTKIVKTTNNKKKPYSILRKTLDNAIKIADSLTKLNDTTNNPRLLEVSRAMIKIGNEIINGTNVRRVRRKRGVVEFFTGGLAIYNHVQIKSIKKNINKLYEQNKLQERQIKDLTHYLNLTATRVQLHDKMLYDLEVRLSWIEHVMAKLHEIVRYQAKTNSLFLDAQVVIDRLQVGLLTMRSNVEQVYKYLRVMASNKIDPVMIPPSPLRGLLKNIEEEMRYNPRLKLPYDPDTEVYMFYSIVQITPVVVEDTLVMLLTIPLMDKSLKLNIYQIHSLPALQPTLGVIARYQIENKYIAIDDHGLFVAMPDEIEVRICLVTRGGLCMMNQALHPVDTVDWCMYALFIQNEERIIKDCKLKFNTKNTTLAESLGGYLWVVSSLIGSSITVRCLEDNHVIEIQHPIQIIEIGNGCEGYSPSVKIPAKNELSGQGNIGPRSEYFMEFNYEYSKIQNVGPWDKMNLENYDKEEIAKMVKKLPALPPINYENLNIELDKLDDYPLEIPMGVMAVWIGIITVALIIKVVLVVCYIKRFRAKFGMLAPIQNLLQGNTNGEGLNEFKLMMKNLLSSDTGNLGFQTAIPGDNRDTSGYTTRRLGEGATINKLVDEREIEKTVREVLSTPKQQVRYIKYLNKSRHN